MNRKKNEAMPPMGKENDRVAPGKLAAGYRSVPISSKYSFAVRLEPIDRESGPFHPKSAPPRLSQIFFRLLSTRSR